MQTSWNGWFPQVQLFRWVEKEDGVQELQTEIGYHGHVLALYMQVSALPSSSFRRFSALTRRRFWFAAV